MINIDKHVLRSIAAAAKSAPSWYAVGEFGDVVEPAKPEWKPVHEFCKTFTVERVLALLDELEAAEKRIAELDEKYNRLGVAIDAAITRGVVPESHPLRSRLEMLANYHKRIAELSASHGKLREAMAGIHNTIRGEGAYTPLTAILNASKRAYEESAAATGKGEAS